MEYRFENRRDSTGTADNRSEEHTSALQIMTNDAIHDADAVHDAVHHSHERSPAKKSMRRPMRYTAICIEHRSWNTGSKTDETVLVRPIITKPVQSTCVWCQSAMFLFEMNDCGI